VTAEKEGSMRGIMGVIALAAVIAGCDDSAAVHGVPPTDPPARAVGVPTPGVDLVAQRVTLEDRRGDLVDGNREKVSEHAPVDILNMTGYADGDELHLTLALAGTAPRTRSPLDQETTYLFAVEKDGSGQSDYWITLRNRGSGVSSPELIENTGEGGTRTSSGDTFPGAMEVDENTVKATVRLDALGDPSTLRISAITQGTDFETGDVLAEDQVPEGRQDTPGDAWLTLGE
jgi:hypothetical protein